MPNTHFLTRLLALALMMLGLTAATPAALGAPREPIKVVVTPQRAKTPVGDTFAVAVRFTIEHGYHIWPNKPEPVPGLDDLVAIPTTAGVNPDAETKPTVGVRVLADQGQWPKPDEVKVAAGGKTMTIKSYEQDFTAYVPIVIGADAKVGPASVPLRVSFQACDETSCMAPEEVDVTVTFEIVAAGAGKIDTPGSEAALFAGFNAAAVDVSKASPTPADPGTPTNPPTVPPRLEPVTEKINLLGLTFDLDPRGPVGLALLGLLAFAGGMILNLTPCVLPVIPLKILGLQNAAGSRSRLVYLGLMTFLGIIATWMAVAVLMSVGVLTAISEVNSYWQFNAAIGVMMFAMAAGTFGAFNVGLPNWVYAFNPDHKTARGAFTFGILTVVLATPCVAPLMGAAVGIATKLSPTAVLVIFLLVGLGMGLPYFILAVNPAWLKHIPKAGPASDLLKQVLGMFIIAVGVFFTGVAFVNLTYEEPWLTKTVHWWVIASIVGIAAAWLSYRTFRITSSPFKRIIFPLIGLAFFVFAGAWASVQTKHARDSHERDVKARTDRIAALEAALAKGGGAVGDYRPIWRDYDPAAVDKAIAAGKTVVLDFTAEWCLICKTLESTVLYTEAIDAALKQPNVESFKIDLTSRKAPGWARLKSLNEVGIPLLAIYGPGQSQVWKSNAYTIDDVTEAIKRAGGGK